MLQLFKETKLSARAQLFLFSLIALYYERKRKKGGDVTCGYTEGSFFKYRVIVRDREISKKFNFSVDTLWRIRWDLKIKKIPITVKQLKVFKKRGVRYPYERWFKKQFDHEFGYDLKVEKRGKIILIPTSIIYDKNLTTKEKLSILWYLSLKEKFGRPPRIKELEKASGISDKTIGKALKKSPQLLNL